MLENILTLVLIDLETDDNSVYHGDLYRHRATRKFETGQPPTSLPEVNDIICSVTKCLYTPNTFIPKLSKTNGFSFF